MRSAIIVVASVLLGAGSVQAQSIGGSYTVQGTNFDGSPYGGEAMIVLTSDVTCEIAWVSGSTTSTGICMRSGSVFSAAYSMNGDIGLIIYEVMPDGVLNGSWTIAGKNAVGYEMLIPN